MKTKATLIAVLFSATGTIWANGGGGLSVESADESASNFVPSQVEVTEISIQDSSDQPDRSGLYDSAIITDYTFDTSA